MYVYNARSGARQSAAEEEEGAPAAQALTGPKESLSSLCVFLVGVSELQS